jgi:hypothetical protein
VIVLVIVVPTTMVVTRQEAKTIFDHILDQVISRHGTNDLKTALVRDGVDDLFSLLNIDDATIDDLQYPDPNDATNLLEVRRSDKSMIKLWRDYVLYRESKGDPIGDNWLQVTQESFDEFRLSSTNVARLSSFATTLPTMSVSPGTTTASKFSKVDLFRKGIKRDPSLFPTLKDEKFNDSWHRSFMTQARAQDVDKVLDESYVPGTQEEKELFAEQQKYIYAVLESKVLTDVGKSFVREHEKDYDAQAVYGKLKAHHLKSTKAMIESSTILSYVTSARLGNGEWKGTTEGFVLHWQNQVRLYERQVPPSDHFSDGQKRVMLENAVHGITELRQVKNNADLEKTKTGIVLSYDQYASLLLSAAAAYDTQFGTKNSNRHVFNHEIYDWDNNETVDGDSFDIETPVTTIQAYASVLNKIRSNMNSDMKP